MQKTAIMIGIRYRWYPNKETSLIFDGENNIVHKISKSNRYCSKRSNILDANYIPLPFFTTKFPARNFSKNFLLALQSY